MAQLHSKPFLKEQLEKYIHRKGFLSHVSGTLIEKIDDQILKRENNWTYTLKRYNLSVLISIVHKI